MKCFALKANECTILKTSKCERMKCSFYKTGAEAVRDGEKAFKRISKLSSSKQDYIAKMYFRDEKPWNK